MCAVGTDKVSHESHSCTMGWNDPLDLKLDERFQGRTPLRRVGAKHVHPPKNRVNGSPRAESTNITQRGNDTRVRAPQNDDEPFVRIKEHRLVVHQGIGPQSRRIEEKVALGSVEALSAWDLSSRPEPRQYFGGACRGPETATRVKPQYREGRHSDFDDLVERPLGKFGLERSGVGIQGSARSHIEHGSERSRVVVVAMAKRNGVERTQIDAKMLRVVLQSEPLAGVEEDGTLSPSNQPGEPVFSEQAALLDVIVDEKRRGRSETHRWRVGFPVQVLLFHTGHFPRRRSCEAFRWTAGPRLTAPRNMSWTTSGTRRTFLMRWARSLQTLPSRRSAAKRIR